MEKFQEARDSAKKKIQIADHMLSVTYPLVKDTKLLLAIMENIFLAYSNAMSAILYRERLFKMIPPFQETFESKLSMFRENCLPKYKIDKEHLRLIQDIRSTIIEHRKSPVEFTRKDRFVICSDSYNMKSIGVEEMKAYINKAKVFIEVMDKIVGKDEGIFR